MRERQSYVHEIDMLIASLVGIFDGMPECQLVGMEHGKRFSSESCIPKVGVLVAIDHCRASHHIVVVPGQVESPMPLLLDGSEELLVGNESFGLQPVVMFEQFYERS